MHNQSYKFNLLVSWCCLLSISIVTMIAMIAKGNNQVPNRDTQGKGQNGHEAHNAEYRTGSGQSSVDFIHLELDSDKPTWTHSASCVSANTSLLLQNDSVIIQTGGFYFTYAQVTFVNINETHEGTVTLVANENVPGKRVRKLSEAEHGYGTVSMSGVIRLRRDDRVKLNVSTNSIILLKEPSKTYWGLFLLAKREDE